MATKFDTIIDMALVTIQDYKLDNLYDKDQKNFLTITTAFLLKGLPNFVSCRKSLSYNIEARTFDSDFDELEISILADLWAYEWFKFHVQNVTQFENKMTPSDFKHFSEAQNLKEKSEYLDRLREKYSQKIVEYQLNNIDWASWSNGNYGL